MWALEGRPTQAVPPALASFRPELSQRAPSEGWCPSDRPYARRRHRLLDAILLDVFDRDPAQLEAAFAALFAANPAERILRFLDEDTRPDEELRLAASMPPAPYLRALVSRVSPGRRAAVAGRPAGS